jgi:hypothetical protein
MATGGSGVIPICPLLTRDTRRRVGHMLRTLHRQYACDLTDAEAEVTALRHRLSVIDNAVSDYSLGGKRENGCDEE